MQSRMLWRVAWKSSQHAWQCGWGCGFLFFSHSRIQRSMFVKVGMCELRGPATTTSVIEQMQLGFQALLVQHERCFVDLMMPPRHQEKPGRASTAIDWCHWASACRKWIYTAQLVGLNKSCAELFDQLSPSLFMPRLSNLTQRWRHRSSANGGRPMKLSVPCQSEEAISGLPGQG